MSKAWSLALVFGILFFSGCSDLKWETKTARAEVHPVQLKTTMTYPFKNTGKTTLEIIKIKPSCACLLPRLPKNTFAPGETGVLTVVFDLEDRTGPQRKNLQVFTSTKSEKPSVLYAEVNIPEAYRLSTKRMQWSESGPHEPKTCRLTNVSKSPVKLRPAISSTQGIKAETRTVKEGFEYDVIVQPDKDLKIARAVIRIGTECPAGLKESKTYKLYVVVK
jgi:hypothetical protein